MAEKTIHNCLYSVCTFQARLPDKVAAVARGVFLEFDRILVLPIHIMFVSPSLATYIN